MARKINIDRKYLSLKKLMKDYLVSKGVYEKTDDYQLEELIYNLKLADDAKQDIELRGLVVGEEGWRANPSVNIYHNCIKNVNAIGTKLGINVQERQKLQLTSESVDELDELLN